jgi:vacuolar-type H+-ATPase subunit H
MNDDRIQQVMQIEKEAQELFDSAAHDAEQILLQAEQEAETLIEKERTATEKEARQIVAEADADEERKRILAEADEKINRTSNLAKGHFDRAVNYVLNRVAGRK